MRGIIPARAGFTPPPASAPRPWSDHPRSRGVYALTFALLAMASGSSPLARGLRRNRDLAHGVLRIIPARAGFTHTIERKETTNADHPRSRGVYPTPKGKLQ